MKVREATLEDVCDLVEMGRHFRSQSIYAQQFSENAVQMETTVRALLARHDAAVFVADLADVGLVGMLVVIVAPHLFSGQLMATELVWWVEPNWRGRVGLKLLRVAESWAKAMGAVALQIGRPMPSPTVAYDRLGYTEVERLYQRNLR